MYISHIVKRDGTLKPFKIDKITTAIDKAMIAVGHGNKADAEVISKAVLQVLEQIKQTDSRYTPSIEAIQNIVEDKLMSSYFHTAAKAYILYRNEQTHKREKNIFEKRLHLKPYEYPEILEYVDAIRHSYWIHTEFNFTSDIQDFKIRLNHPEREAIKTYHACYFTNRGGSKIVLGKYI